MFLRHYFKIFRYFFLIIVPDISFLIDISFYDLIKNAIEYALIDIQKLGKKLESFIITNTQVFTIASIAHIKAP